MFIKGGASVQDIEYFVNRVINGDCRKVLREIPSSSVDLVVTDPPYGINYVDKWDRFNTKGIKGDDKNAVYLFRDVANQLYRILRNNSHIYVFTRWDVMSGFKDAMERAGFTVMNALVIPNINHGLGSLDYQFAPKYEMVLFGMKGKRKFNQTKIKKKKGTRDQWVYRFPDVIDWLVGDEADKVSEIHPMQKSLEILEFFILLSSNENDIVIDPFSGSGSVAVASLDLNRRFICIEKDKKYYEASLKYIEDFKAGKLKDKLKEVHKKLNITQKVNIESFIN